MLNLVVSRYNLYKNVLHLQNTSTLVPLKGNRFTRLRLICITPSSNIARIKQFLDFNLVTPNDLLPNGILFCLKYQEFPVYLVLPKRYHAQFFRVISKQLHQNQHCNH